MKERLLAELDARIAQHVNGDSSGVLDEQALALVTKLATLGAPDASSMVRVAALHLCRSQALPGEHGEADLELAEAIFTNLHTVDPRLVSPEVRELFGLASPYDSGIARMREYEQTGRTEHLERAVSLFRQDVVEQQADRARSLHTLGMALFHRFERLRQPADLDEAVAHSRAALAAAAPRDPRRAGFRSGLAAALSRRYEQTGQQADLDEATALGRDSVPEPGWPS